MLKPCYSLSKHSLSLQKPIFSPHHSLFIIGLLKLLGSIIYDTILSHKENQSVTKRITGAAGQNYTYYVLSTTYYLRQGAVIRFVTEDGIDFTKNNIIFLLYIKYYKP